MKRVTVPLLLFLACLGADAARDPKAKTTQKHIDLNVAIFAYLPDASAGIERIEEKFEHRHKNIDLDLELWNPYEDGIEDDGLRQLPKFDIVEIDVCRIDQFIGGMFGGLDVIPADVRGKPNDYIGGAKSLAHSAAGQYVVPHWICGHFLVIWSTNYDVIAARSFDTFLNAVDPSAGKPLLAGMWGSTGLGEFYADAMIDIYGQKKARDHLLSIGRHTDGCVQLDPKALAAVLKLADELTPENRSNLSHYYNHSYVLPRQFAHSKNAVLLGYSEWLYYTERELQLTPSKYPPILKSGDVVVRQLSFGPISNGTPSWIDGFVIPKGNLARKRAAVCAFLKFINSDEAYLAFAEPTQYMASTYLLPAKASAYDSETLIAKQPLLPEYRKNLDNSFPVTQYDLWQGIRAAGSLIKKHLNSG